MKRMISLLLLTALLLTGCASAGKTEETKVDLGIYDATPTEDSAMNILFVSNSTCCYFPDELYGMLTAAGYEDVTLAVTYYSGCSVQTHYQWYQEGAANYELRYWSKSGVGTHPNYSLENALYFRNWDIISFDNNSRSFSSCDTATALDLMETPFSQLVAALREKAPNARYVWHEYWAETIGYSMSYTVDTVETRTRNYNTKKAVMHKLAETYSLEMVPTGDAWEKVRDLPLFTTPIEGLGAERFTLNSRLHNNKFTDDFTHDGDIGGGQYLNACVWFEVITGQSCLDNTFRPVYKVGDIDCSLTEEKIQILKNAAHEAVAELKAK